jgi:hypothetical protein
MGSPESSCSRGSSVLLNDVDAGVDARVEQRPAAFDRAEEAVPGTGTYRVRDERSYIEGVVANLRARGYCAQPDYVDPLELIQVKSPNEYQVLVYTGGGGTYGVCAENARAARWWSSTEAGPDGARPRGGSYR